MQPAPDGSLNHFRPRAALPLLFRAQVHLHGVRTSVGAGRARLSALGADREHWLELPPSGTATPAQVAEANPGGIHILPAVHEDGARTTWRTVHDLLTGKQTGDELASLADDLDQLSAAVTLSRRR